MAGGDSLRNQIENELLPARQERVDRVAASGAMRPGGAMAGDAPPIAMVSPEPLYALTREMLPLVDLTRIGGDGAAAQVGTIEAWVAGRSAGAECVYAIGHLPVWAKGPKLVRDLAERGFVHLFHDRKPNPKHYIARRTGRPWNGAITPLRIAREVSCLSPVLAPMMDRLIELAEAGAPCPSNAQWADELGVTKRQAAYLFCCLGRANAISVRLVTEPPFRVVTVIKSGKSTGVAA